MAYESGNNRETTSTSQCGSVRETIVQTLHAMRAVGFQPTGTKEREWQRLHMDDARNLLGLYGMTGCTATMLIADILEHVRNCAECQAYFDGL